MLEGAAAVAAAAGALTSVLTTTQQERVARMKRLGTSARHQLSVRHRSEFYIGDPFMLALTNGLPQQPS